MASTTTPANAGAEFDAAATARGIARVPDLPNRPGRREGPHWNIAQYWAGRLDCFPRDEAESRFPENLCWWIGLGEPYCFACHILMPVEDGLGMKSWQQASRFLDRAHLVDRSQGGLDGPQNVMLLCKQCHREMPEFTGEEAELALLWVRTHEYWEQRVLRGQAQRQRIAMLTASGAS